MKVTVIGAGVAGLATAMALAERGAAVTVLERAPMLGADACSRMAGGMLAPDCERDGAEPLITELGREALDWWAARVPGVVRRGSLVVAPARDGAEFDRFARRTTGHSALDSAAIANLEPDLAGRFARGLFFAGEGHLDPRAALPALATRLTELGGDLRLGVDGLAGPVAGTLVDCRGFAARDALPDLRGVKGEMALVRCRDIALTRPVRLLHPRFPAYVVPRGDGLYMIGATSIESDERGRVTARSLVELLNVAYALHPAFAEAEIMEIGADVRPAFPDNLPRLVRAGATLYVNGLYRHGFLLSPALARMAAATVLDGADFPEVTHADPGQRRSA